MEIEKRKVGRPRLGEPKVRLSVSVDEGIFDLLKHKAELDGRSISELVQKILKSSLNKRRKA